MRSKITAGVAVLSMMAFASGEAKAKDRGGEFEKQMGDVRLEAEQAGRMRRADAAAATAEKLLEMIPDQKADSPRRDMRGIQRVVFQETAYEGRMIQKSAGDARALLEEIRKSGVPKGSGNLIGAVYSVGRKSVAGGQGDFGTGDSKDYLSKEKVDALFSAAVHLISLAELQAQGAEPDGAQAVMAAKAARELVKMSVKQYSRFRSHQMRDMIRYEITEDSYDRQGVVSAVGSASEILVHTGFPRGMGERLRDVYPMGSLKRASKGLRLPYGGDPKDYVSKEKVDILFLAAVQIADLLEKR